MKNPLTKKQLSPAKAIRRLGFRQTIRGAVIVGLIIGVMMGFQGFAYAEAYPSQATRDAFVASLAAVPSLGFMAGEIENARFPESYAIYKSIAVVTPLVAVWGLMVATKLLRGQEEDERWEVVVSGAISKRRASANLLIGFSYSFMITFVISLLFIVLSSLDEKVGLSFYHAFLMNVGVFLPGLVFTALGVLTSQLAITRQRALFYGLITLLVLYTVRGAANSVSDFNWLKQWTPFGWTDLLNPVLDPHLIWLVPSFIFSTLFITAGIFLTAKRDLGASILPQSTYARSHFLLLGSPLTFNIRQTLPAFFWWMVGTVAYTAILASLTSIAVDILKESPVFTQIIGSLGGSVDNLKLAFIGFGAVFTAMILLIMSAVFMNSIRREEAKGYLENLLVRPVARSTWLATRLILTVLMTLTISLLSALAIWLIVSAQGVSLDLGTMLQWAVALIGTVVLVLGIGTLSYGMLPRLAVIIMFAIIVWAFLIDVLKSVLTLDDWVLKSSLFHYIEFSPKESPDWTTFAWLVGIGTVLAIIGIVAFSRRDIISE